MTQIREIQLKPYNSFGFEAKCKGIFFIHQESDFHHFLSSSMTPYKILGGGSNVLICDDIDGYIIKNEIKGIHKVSEDEDHVFVNVGAGEAWHQFVLWTLSQGLGGLENLALIPGTVGAAPMQNIGAYGIEQEQSFFQLSAIDVQTGTKKVFSKEACAFGYRESIFKNEAKNQYFITDVTYVLNKRNHALQTNYGAIQEVLGRKNIDHPTINDVAEAVMDIRRSKLPDPNLIGNAGSFFKNPVITLDQYHGLLSAYPEMPHYPISAKEVKVPAAWLIEKSGFKGQKLGHVGVHHQQALVLVHFGHGKGSEILELAQKIQKKVTSTFGIEISPEVNIW